MINKKYKCPACGKDVECDVIRVPGTGYENPFGEFIYHRLYHYVFTCKPYACNMPFQVGVLNDKPDDEKTADELYEYWVEEYKKYKKENKK